MTTNDKREELLNTTGLPYPVPDLRDGADLRDAIAADQAFLARERDERGRDDEDIWDTEEELSWAVGQLRHIVASAQVEALETNRLWDRGFRADFAQEVS